MIYYGLSCPAHTHTRLQLTNRSDLFRDKVTIVGVARLVAWLIDAIIWVILNERMILLRFRCLIYSLGNYLVQKIKMRVRANCIVYEFEEV